MSVQTTRQALVLVNALRAFAKTAEVRDLHKIADVADQLATDAEEADEDRRAAEGLKLFHPMRGDVIKFIREGLAEPLIGTVLKTPDKGSRRIAVSVHDGKPGRCTTHIMIKRIVEVTERSDAAGPRKRGKKS